MQTGEQCRLCGNGDSDDLYGYAICDECKSGLGLFTDQTIKKHVSMYGDPAKKHSYEEEIVERLDFIEKDYVKKKIKLLHVLDRLKNMS